MRINIAYFTSTGNSLFLCTKAKEQMEKAGHVLHACPVECIGHGCART